MARKVFGLALETLPNLGQVSVLVKAAAVDLDKLESVDDVADVSPLVLFYVMVGSALLNGKI